MIAITKLGKYELYEKLGEGATAEVYRAIDTSLNREVALKILKPALVADASAFFRFTQEAHAAASLFHPHIATVLDVDEQNGRYFIVMRYFAGRSLDKVLRDGPLSHQEAAILATQVAEALDYAHKSGILHRDVKPSNIIQVEPGQYVLTDFGLARALMSTGFTSHSGAALGTPSYLAPEIWLNQPATPATDQYALACVLYEALTGEVLFAGDTPPAIMTKHVLNSVGLPEHNEKLVSPAIKRVLSRALQKDPSKRFDSMEGLAVELRKALTVNQSPTKEEVKKISGRMVSVWSNSRLDLVLPIEEIIRNLLRRLKDLSNKAASALTNSFGYLMRLIQKNIRLMIFVTIAGLIFLVMTFAGMVNLLTPSIPTLLPTSLPVQTEAPTVTFVPPTPTLGIGSRMNSDKDGMVMVYVPAGNFLMGLADSDSFAQPDEKPQHTVYLDAFWIDQTDVTNAMYAKCVNVGSCNQPTELNSSTRSSYYSNSQFDNYPVIYVNWDMADKYCKWAGRQLPTEAQWEKAARGTDGRIYPWGNNAPDNTLLNYNSNVGDTTAVGNYPKGASPYGALDMAGNVSQWVADWYGDAYYAISPSSNPLGSFSDPYHDRVFRGSAWPESWLWKVSSAYRYGNVLSNAYDSLGFRCSNSAPYSFAPVTSITPTSTLKASCIAISSATQSLGSGAGRIAFISKRNGYYEIFAMNSDGSSVTQLTNIPNDNYNPAWSPDGAKIAFVSDWQVYVMNSDCSNTIKLTNMSVETYKPAWSPDGAKIAFVSYSTLGYNQIYVMNSDGSGVTQLTNSPNDNKDPAWSPDGKQIVFDSERKGQFEIFIMNFDGSGITQLLAHSGDNYNPVWSPNGKQIAFVSDTNGSPQIYVMNSDGSSLTQLTTNGGWDPAWSPDGTKIAFSDENIIEVMNSDGSGVTQLTSDSTDDKEPSWSPR